MQDEEGYTVLNLRSQEKTTIRLSPGRIQDSPLSSQCFKCMLGILGALCIILTLALIILTILVFQGGSHKGPTGTPPNTPADSDSGRRSLNRAEGSSRPEDVLAHLRQNLCDLQTHSRAEALRANSVPWTGCHSEESLFRKEKGRRYFGLEFMLRYKGRLVTWIGLTREQADKPWKWVHGTPFNDLFPMRGGGEGTYLNDDKGISSSRCTTGRRWVCSRPA
ncbi:unnamed protein product [Eretmochelys imbricata]